MKSAVCKNCVKHVAYIAELEARLVELEAKVREQAALIVDLAKKLQDKDLPKSGTPTAEAKATPAAAAKKSSGRKPGGQPGHAPQLKQLPPPEKRHRGKDIGDAFHNLDNNNILYRNCPQLQKGDGDNFDISF